MSRRYEVLFQDLDKRDEIAFIPFVTLGDPDIATSKSIIRTLIQSGADALELGFPFSDPIADGPTIQKASLRALNNGVSIKQCVQLIREIREEFPNVPIGLLLYCNLVLKQGVDIFYSMLSDVGVDSILLADVPLLEIQPFLSVAEQYQINQVLILPPDASEEVLHLIAKNSQGYVYLLSRVGVTGTEVEAAMPPATMIERLAAEHSAPPILGFGISQEQHVKDAKNAGAKGVISGSAVVKIIEKNSADNPEMLSQLSIFVRKMKRATLA